MTRLVFHADRVDVPVRPTGNDLHVLLYGGSPEHEGTGPIGGSLPEQVARLRVVVPTVAYDFLTIAMAVTASDTFVSRALSAADAWGRELDLTIPLADPEPWKEVRTELENTLKFLSGDVWSLTFRKGGPKPPSRSRIERLRNFHDLSNVVCACLFSGGLDSMIGVHDLLQDESTPLLVSHSHRDDKQRQDEVKRRLGWKLPRFAANANPVFKGGGVVRDVSMRTRSFNFLAYGVVAASAINAWKESREPTTLFVPENGFIALNAPLTPRRIGSHSTRTTHPEFLAAICRILEAVGLAVRLENPYRHRTKGEMLADLGGDKALLDAAMRTVSCGKWKRDRKQCGRCVPCMIRRASFHAAGIDDRTYYKYDPGDLWHNVEGATQLAKRDDIMALRVAISRKERLNPARQAIRSGPLPLDAAERQKWVGVYQRGLDELGSYMKGIGIPV